MKDTNEESKARHIAAAMLRNDVKIGMSRLREVEQEFLREFVNMDEKTTIPAMRAFFTDTASLQIEHGRAKAAKKLAGMMLKDEPTHHSIAPKQGEEGTPENQGNVALQNLTQRLVNAAITAEVQWFAKSAAAQARTK